MVFYQQIGPLLFNPNAYGRSGSSGSGHARGSGIMPGTTRGARGVRRVGRGG